MRMMTSLVLAIGMLVGCGADEPQRRDYRTKKETPDPYEEIRKQILQLQGELQSLAQSDWATCSASLSQAAQNICKIAQAATDEARIEMRGAIADLATQLESRLDDAQADFATMSGVWKRLYGVDFPETSGAPTPTLADCTAFNSNASAFECVKVQGSAISALQTTVAVLSGSITGAMLPVMIGNENISAGPLYEQVVRLNDFSRINAYTNGLSAALTVPTNPINASNGSSTVTITTSAAHGLAVNNFVRMEGCTSGRGFTSGHLNDTFEVLSVPTATTFTLTLAGTATSGGSLGGTTCILKRFSGAGFSTIWTDAQASDVAVRRTTGGSRAYNFAICKTTSGDGYICYSNSNNNATFGTISAIPGWSTTCASSGSIVCK